MDGWKKDIWGTYITDIWALYRVHGIGYRGRFLGRFGPTILLFMGS
jgi:hypothetical protein